MLVTRYGLKKPARINYGREDPGPRAIFNAARNEFLRYPRWILENPDGTQVIRTCFPVCFVALIKTRGVSSGEGITLILIIVRRL